jgi:hypothetical protein
VAARPGVESYLRRTRKLAILALVAAAYSALMHAGTITGSERLDGQIGVMLGLYICSHPAANGVDVLFFDRQALRRLASGWTGVGWLVLNLFVLVAGWFVIVVGAGHVAQAG